MMHTQQHNKSPLSGDFTPSLSLSLSPSLSRLLLLLCTGILLIWLGSASYAQPEFQTMDPPPGITANQVNDVAQQLWCPLCSGVRLDVCELKACDQMKDMIAIKLSEGEDVESIRAYFIDQYGPQVLGEPPREGFNWLAWIMPFLMMALGGTFLWMRARGMVKTGIGLEGAAVKAFTSPDKKRPAVDDYESKLEEELKRYV